MKRFFIKTLILSLFVSLSFGQSVYSAEGIDIKELKRIKNVKNVFKKPENKKNKTIEQKELKLEEIPNDTTTPFGAFEEDDYMFPESVREQEVTPVSDKNANKKVKKAKKERKFFKKKVKNLNNENLEEESIQEETPVNNDSKDRSYIGDQDLVYIKEIEVFGNNLLDTAYIKEQLTSKEGAQYNRSEVSDDLRALYSTGYFTRNLRALPIKIDDNNVRLRIIVEENAPVAGFGIIGNNSISTADIMNILSKYEGKPQNILNINNAINEIQDLYASRGYILARVSKVQDDPDGYINVLINEGVIGDIIVEGNNKTKDFIVKRNIFLQPGNVYNENTMRSDILRLMGTQAFRDVQRELKQDETTGLYDV